MSSAVNHRKRSHRSEYINRRSAGLAAHHMAVSVDTRRKKSRGLRKLIERLINRKPNT